MNIFTSNNLQDENRQNQEIILNSTDCRILTPGLHRTNLFIYLFIVYSTTVSGLEYIPSKVRTISD
jgi:hypothetical protein